jgi:diacylglycerol kinase (ATP)
MPGPAHHDAVLVIVNPTSGTGTRRDGGRQTAEHAAALAEASGLPVEVSVTERAGHARDLAAAAVARGIATVVAWGGDGTINEVASALAFQETALGIVPLDARAAFEVAVSGGQRRLDAGMLDGRYFFNVAGLGLDGRVAQRFADIGRDRRGLRRYVQAATREVLRSDPADVTITRDGATTTAHALIVAFANTRQYGNGAFIAPSAVPDDGVLDLVVVDTRPLWRLVAGVPALFTGTLAGQPGVRMERFTDVRVSGTRPLSCHVDGEPHVVDGPLSVRVCPAALRVRVPRNQ